VIVGRFRARDTDCCVVKVAALSFAPRDSSRQAVAIHSVCSSRYYLQDAIHP